MVIRKAWEFIALCSGYELCDSDSSNRKTFADGNRYDVPELIFQGTVYTYDIWVVAFLVLGSSILIREHVNKTEKFEYKWRILMIACFVLGCLPKAVYAPLILSGLFLEKTSSIQREMNISLKVVL